MVNKRTKYTDTLNDNVFMGITVPEFEHFKITLVEHVRVGHKGLEEVSRDNNFNIKIKPNITKAYKDKLDNELKVAFKLGWAPYKYDTQQYEYFTSRFMLDSEKIDRLQNIFQVLTDFEIYYKDAVKESVQLFNQDAIDKRSYVDHEVVVKFNEEKNCFVVMALRFLGEGKYPILANASIKKGKISETEYPQSGFFNEFVDLKKQKRDLYYFEINPEGYLEIRNLIEVKEKTRELFQEKQVEILEKLGHNNLAHFDEENIFDLKVIYDDNLKMFEFFCKGYFESEKGERSLLAFLSVNHILSRELTEQEIKDNFDRLEDGSYKENKFLPDGDLDHKYTQKYNQYKYNLEIQEESAKRDKKLYLTLDYNDTLKEIINNYESNKSFFGRKIKEIKIKNSTPINSRSYIDTKYPSIYLNDDGRCFYVLSMRENFEVVAGTITSPTKYNEKGEIIPAKVSKGRSASFGMKALEITHEEAVEFLYEHSWKDKIIENSIYLNTEVWMTNANKPQLNAEDRLKSFNMILLNNKIQGDSKKKLGNVPKTKRLKI